MNKQHTGPQPSEQALIAPWDAIDRERRDKGEKAAAALAKAALKAATKEIDRDKAV